MSEWETRLGMLVRKYRKEAGMTQAMLAAAMTDQTKYKLSQPEVSEHERGSRWEIGLLSAYVRVLGIPDNEWRAALDMPIAEPEARPKGFAEIVAQDRSLSKAARDHLLNQYELLQMATQHERGGHPVLREGKRQKRA